MAKTSANKAPSMKQKLEEGKAVEFADAQSAKDADLSFDALTAEIRDSLPKQAQKAYTAFVTKAVTTLRNVATIALTFGEELVNLRKQVTETAFTRTLNSLLPKIGGKRATMYRWMRSATVLIANVPNKTCREAIIVATDGGNFLFAQSESGQTVATAAFTQALAEFPIPSDEDVSWDIALDWARTINLYVEQNRPKNEQAVTVGTTAKDAFKLFEFVLRGRDKGSRRLFDGNMHIAVAFVAQCAIALRNFSEPLGTGLLAGLSQPDLKPEDIANLAMAEFKSAQKARSDAAVKGEVLRHHKTAV